MKLSFENTAVNIRNWFKEERLIYSSGLINGEVSRGKFNFTLELLQNFLRVYKAQTEFYLNDELGLCSNFALYLQAEHSDKYEYWEYGMRYPASYIYYAIILEEMFCATIECVAEEGDTEEPMDYFQKSYPFGGGEVYDDDAINKSHHKNPLRLAWIEAVLKA